MRSLVDMDTIQIEITNACTYSCSNCTRFCGHTTPYFMDLNTVEKALDSMIGYPKMVGIMGGEPLLHPKFETICKMAKDRFNTDQLGLWTTLPIGKEHYREVICDTFNHIFVNDHSRNDVYHAPILIASKDIITDYRELFFIADKCWLQNYWSAAINPNGAFFCEIAASMSLLFNIKKGWKVEEKWWLRVPIHYKEQAMEFCPRCGVCLPLQRRISIEGVDDISKSNYELLKNKSKKIKAGKFVLHDNIKLVENPEPMASYKDATWRQGVANRYGIYLMGNCKGFQTPILRNNYHAINE